MKQISNIKNNTASPCPTNSLFKYVFHYSHGLGGTSKFPQVAYSQDFINEKKQFRKGITPDFKNQWRAFVEDIDFDNEVFMVCQCVSTNRRRFNINLCRES